MQTKLYDLIEHVGEVWFTLAKCNLRSLEGVLAACKIDEEQKKEWVKQFLNDTDQFGYYIYHVNKRIFYKAGSEQNASSTAAPPTKSPGRMDELRILAKKQIATFFPQNELKCLAIFDYLVSKIPLSSFHSSDLAITLKNRETGVIKNLFILDYLQTLLTEEGKPSANMISLHRYILRYAGGMPRVYVKNQYLLRNHTA